MQKQKKKKKKSVSQDKLEKGSNSKLIRSLKSFQRLDKDLYGQKRGC